MLSLSHLCFNLHHILVAGVYLEAFLADSQRFPVGANSIRSSHTSRLTICCGTKSLLDDDTYSLLLRDGWLLSYPAHPVRVTIITILIVYFSKICTWSHLSVYFHLQLQSLLHEPAYDMREKSPLEHDTHSLLRRIGYLAKTHNILSALLILVHY